MTKKKNNHFVPRSYLKRFCAGSKKQITLHNIKSGRTISDASIKFQCSRDYFYTQNPIYEDEFRKIEDRQLALLNEIEARSTIPARGSKDHLDLIACVMFQAGRTASTAAHFNHLVNQFGIAMLRRHLAREGETELLEHLPHVGINTDGSIMDSIAEHLLMYPLIEDLDCTLLLSATSEDFLTSDHPVALCNAMPGITPTERTVGFASRGLILLYPISPKALLLFSDPEVYKIDNPGQPRTLHKTRDIVELNLAQFGNANENVYFSDADAVQETLTAFRKRAAIVRPLPPSLQEAPIISPDGRTGVLLNLPFTVRRLPLPKPIGIRFAARTGRFVQGNALVRDPERVRLVSEVLREFNEKRHKATEQAKRDQDNRG